MTSYYQFEDRKTIREQPYKIPYTGVGGKKRYTEGVEIKGDVVPLQTVDEQICEFVGLPKPDKKHFSPPMYEMTEWAFAALMNRGGGFIEQEHVAWLEMTLTRIYVSNPESQYHGKKTPAQVAAQVKLYEWAFLEQWRFSAWR